MRELQWVPGSRFGIPCFAARGLGHTTDAALNKHLQPLQTLGVEIFQVPVPLLPLQATKESQMCRTKLYLSSANLRKSAIFLWDNTHMLCDICKNPQVYRVTCCSQMPTITQYTSLDLSLMLKVFINLTSRKRKVYWINREYGRN